MRVWIINQYALPNSEPGGTRHHALARELTARGHEVCIVASNVHYNSRKRMPQYSGYQVLDGVPFLWLDTPPYTGNTLDRLWNNVIFTLKLMGPRNFQRLPKPDVIVGSSPQPFAVWAAYRMAKRLKVPFVMEVRDLWPQSLVDLGVVSDKHPMVVLLRKLEYFLYRRAARIISLLPRIPQYVAAVGCDPNKVVWIPNGVDLSLVPPPGVLPSGQPFTVAYVGSHGAADGLDTVLEAAAILQRNPATKHICFRLIGDGPEKPRLMARAESLGLDNVLFNRPVAKSEIYKCLTSADAFVVLVRNSPLYKYGMSFNKLFDYFAMARPILFAGDVPQDPVSEAGGGIVVPPDDPEALARSVHKLAEMSLQERQTMADSGRRYVEANHDMRALSQKFEHVLQEVISDR